MTEKDEATHAFWLGLFVRDQVSRQLSEARNGVIIALSKNDHHVIQAALAYFYRRYTYTRAWVIRAAGLEGQMETLTGKGLLELLLVQDRVANRARDVSGIVLGRRMRLPDAIKEPFLAFLSRNVDAAKKARKTIRELDELYATGFRGAEAKLVESLVDELDEIENDTDSMQVTLRQALMAVEKELHPIDVMFLYRIIEETGDISDMAERIGRRLEVLLGH
jgi:hypothetical protein